MSYLSQLLMRSLWKSALVAIIGISTFHSTQVEGLCSALFQMRMAERGILAETHVQGILHELFPETRPQVVAQQLIENLRGGVSEEGPMTGETSIGERNFVIEYQSLKLGRVGETRVVVLKRIREKEGSWMDPPENFSRLYPDLVQGEIDSTRILWGLAAGNALGRLNLTRESFWERVLAWSQPIPLQEGGGNLFQAIAKVINQKGKVKLLRVKYQVLKRTGNWEITEVAAFTGITSRARDSTMRSCCEALAGGYNEISIQVNLLGESKRVSIPAQRMAFLREIEGISEAEIRLAASQSIYTELKPDQSPPRYRTVGLGENGRIILIQISREKGEYRFLSAREITLKHLQELAGE